MRVFVLAILLGCNNHIEHGLEDDRPITTLTPEEATAYCEAYSELVEESFGAHELCATLVGYVADLENPFDPGALPREECDQIYDDCRREYAENAAVDGVSFRNDQCLDSFLGRDACTLTVEEVTTCLEDVLTRSVRSLRSFSCDNPDPEFMPSEYCESLSLRCRDVN